MAITKSSTQELEHAICGALSPSAVATIIAFLQPATFHKPANEDAKRALREVEWLTNQMTSWLGVKECDRLFEELGL